MSGAFEGTGTLFRLALRRDRLTLPAWVVLFVVMAAVSADATVGLYPDAASRVRAAEAINGTPSLVALYGRIYDVTSLGAIAMIKMGGVGSALLAVLAFMTVVRHTRAEEESGRLELLAGGVLGARAPLVAALVTAGLVAVATGGLTAVALTVSGLSASGSIAFGLAWTATGAVFAGIGAVASQLTTSARAARGLSAAALGLAYLLRAVGDSTAGTQTGWLSWASPIGWGQQVRPYAGDRWPVLLVLGGFTVGCVAVAFKLNGSRDLAGGLFPDRPGPGAASPALRSAAALAWRLQRGVLLAWLVAFVGFGLILGNVASNAPQMFDNPQAQELITALGGVERITDAFIAAEMGFMGVVAAAYGVQAAMRLHVEESSLRLEAVLATGTRRERWLASHTVVALVGSIVLALAFGLAVGAANALRTGAPGDVVRALSGALVQLPAVWVSIALVVALFGVAPRLVAFGWVALVGFLLVGELGPLLELPGWVMDLSPFSHVPRLPGGTFRTWPLVWLSLVVVALLSAGVVGFRRRDLAQH